MEYLDFLDRLGVVGYGCVWLGLVGCGWVNMWSGYKHSWFGMGGDVSK